MTTRRTISILLGAALIAGVAAVFGLFQVYAPVRTDTKPGSLTTVLYLNWIYAASFGGEILASTTTGPNNGIQIDIHPGGEGLDPIKFVRDNQFGVASADEIIRAIDKGADIVIIGVLNNEHPGAFVASVDSGIVKPQDFVGKRVGLLPFGSMGLIYQALLDMLGIDRSKITEVVVSPDLRPFMSGRTNDVQPIFIFDETTTLDKFNFKYNTIKPSDYGIHFKGQSYFTTSATVRTNPDLVTAFVKSIAEGWRTAVVEPQLVISALKRLSPNADLDREAEMLRRGTPYFVVSGTTILDTDPLTWEPMLSALQKFGITSKRISTEQILNMTFVRNINIKEP